MADEPIVDVEKIKQGILALRAPAEELIKILRGLIGDNIMAGVKEGAEKGSDQVERLFGMTADKIKKELGEGAGSGIAEGIEAGFKEAGIIAGQFGNQVNELFGALKIGFGQVDKQGLRNLFADASQFAAENAIQLAVVAKGEEPLKVLQHVLGPAEAQMMHFSKSVADTFANFSGSARDGEQSGERFGDSINSAMLLASQSMQQLGISEEEAIRNIRQMGEAGINVRKIFDDRGGIVRVTAHVDGLQELDDLSSIILLAKGSGLEAGTAMNYLAAATQKLGYTSDTAAEMFGTFRQVQADSGLPAREVASNLMKGADMLALYGGNVESVASLYKGFIKTIGEGNRLLAGNVFERVVGSLAQMDTGFRAFLGMTGAVGGFGATGVLGSALEVEDALKTGEGLEGIMESLKGAVEKFGGGEVLSKEEAKATGRESQYFMQRQMVGQMLNINDVAILDKVMKMFSEGAMPTTAELETGRAQATREVVGTGQAVMEQTIGPLEKSINAFASVGVEATRNMHDRFIEMGKTVEGFSSTMVNQLKPLMETGAARQLAKKSPGIAAEEALQKAPESMGLGVHNNMATLGSGLGMLNNPDVLFNTGTVAEINDRIALRPMQQPDAGPMRLKTPDFASVQQTIQKQRAQQIGYENPEPIQLTIKATVDGNQLRLDPMVESTFAKMWPKQFDKSLRLSVTEGR